MKTFQPLSSFIIEQLIEQGYNSEDIKNGFIPRANLGGANLSHVNLENFNLKGLTWKVLLRSC